MNPILHCATNYWVDIGIGRKVDVAIVCEDDGFSFSHLDISKMFEPWSDWFNIYQIVHSVDEVDLDAVGVVFLGVRSYGAAEQALSARKGSSNVKIITPNFGERDSWQDCVVREVAHHDFEHGGVNEWDGAPTKYSPHILRMHSRTHTRSYFPEWAFNEMPTSSKLRAIDLGCGPISHLRWGAIHGFLDLVLVWHECEGHLAGAEEQDGAESHRCALDTQDRRKSPVSRGWNTTDHDCSAGVRLQIPHQHRPALRLYPGDGGDFCIGCRRAVRFPSLAEPGFCGSPALCATYGVGQC